MVADSAYDVCLRLARQHYENFPVASKLLPRAVRRDVAAIYAFARTADDFADEGPHSERTRLALLDDWRQRLHRAAEGRVDQDRPDAIPVFTALSATIRRHDLDVMLLDDLLSAFRQDVLVKRYESWNDLLDYCRRSANPVGRLVLRISGYRDTGLDTMSDSICTALQLTNFWQDLGLDWRKGRLYVPLDVARSSGADPRDLDRDHVAPAWRRALSTAVATTREFYTAGRSIGEHVKRPLRWELRATWLGGMRILDRIEAIDFDVLGSRPSLGWRDGLPLAWRLLTWGSSYKKRGSKGS